MSPFPVQQMIAGEGVHWDKVGFDTGMGALFGKILEPFSKLQGWNAGKNSYWAIHQQMVTKFKNGTIECVKWATACKMAAGSFYEYAIYQGTVAGDVVGSLYNDFSHQDSGPMQPPSQASAPPVPTKPGPDVHWHDPITSWPGQFWEVIQDPSAPSKPKKK